jgi:RNase P/RNase MRP subunit p30
MFVDVCFPNKNEEKFIEIAKKLKTKSLCFVYDSPSKAKMIENKKIKIYYGFLSGRVGGSLNFSSDFPAGIFSMKNTVFFIRDFKHDKRSFFTPLSSINQVIIKEVCAKENSLAFGLPLMTKSKMHPKKISQLSFVMGLCEKYNVTSIIGSFAYSPFELRSEKELFTLFNSAFRNQIYVKRSLHTLGNIFDSLF